MGAGDYEPVSCCSIFERVRARNIQSRRCRLAARMRRGVVVAMRGKLTLLVLALTMFSPGCALIKDCVHGVSTSITDCVDDARERGRNWKCAEGTWQQIRASDPHACSRDYAHGVKEGFADYLYGGKEQLPAVAPAHYR